MKCETHPLIPSKEEKSHPCRAHQSQVYYPWARWGMPTVLGRLQARPSPRVETRWLIRMFLSPHSVAVLLYTAGLLKDSSSRRAGSPRPRVETSGNTLRPVPQPASHSSFQEEKQVHTLLPTRSAHLLVNKDVCMLRQARLTA